MTSRRLCQISAAALAALTWWVCVSRPGVLGDEFVAEIIGMFGFLTLLLFGVMFLALRGATGGSVRYWTMGAPDQVRPIGWMILATSAAIVGGYVLLAAFDATEPLWLTVAYLLMSVLVPAAFLVSRRVRWPARTRRPDGLSTILAVVAALGLVAAWTWRISSLPSDGFDPPSTATVLFVFPATIVGSSMEELVFRVLLLTALLDRLGSRLEAVFLSGVAFGLMHVPGELIQPVVDLDWGFFKAVVHDYAPKFLVQVWLGLFLGVLWLRTGSIILISAVHTLLNLAVDFAVGL